MKKINQLKAVLIMLFLVLGVTLYAQDKESKDKLVDLKGKVEKVTIKVDGKDVVFEGKDAERIAKIAKATGESRAFIYSTDDDNAPGMKKRIKVFTSGGGSKCNVVTSDDFDCKVEGNQKKIKVEIRDGKKSITVTTNNDGKEETKTYEGEEAEKFLKDQGEDGKVKVFMKKLGDDECEDTECEDEDHVVMFNKKIGGGCNCCCKSSCNSGGMSHMKMMHGGKGNMMWKMMDDDDEKEVKVIVEKKMDKKKELKETKKEEKK
ncbi:MAG: hypothetical protein Q8L04_01005 [Ignavibacteria bacterium]|nr:hypothetical protein [Ignavibacteria bacterium]